jgi:DNA-directed RNA polymerase I subunit RPA2
VKLSPGSYLAAYVDDTTNKTRFVKYKGDEDAYVDQVRLLGEPSFVRHSSRANIEQGMILAIPSY